MDRAEEQRRLGRNPVMERGARQVPGAGGAVLQDDDAGGREDIHRKVALSEVATTLSTGYVDPASLRRHRRRGLLRSPPGEPEAAAGTRRTCTGSGACFAIDTTWTCCCRLPLRLRLMP